MYFIDFFGGLKKGAELKKKTHFFPSHFGMNESPLVVTCELNSLECFIHCDQIPLLLGGATAQVIQLNVKGLS